MKHATNFERQLVVIAVVLANSHDLVEMICSRIIWVVRFEALHRACVSTGAKSIWHPWNFRTSRLALAGFEVLRTIYGNMGC